MAHRSPTTGREHPGEGACFLPQERSGSGKLILVGCLSVIIAGLLLAGVGGVYVWQNWRGLTAEKVAEVTDNRLRAIHLPDQEREEIMERVEYLATEFREERIEVEQFKALGQALAKSEFLPMLVAKAAYGGYIVPSDLSDTDKARAQHAFGRVAAGYVVGEVTKDELKELLRPLSEDGTLNFKFTEKTLTTNQNMNLKPPGDVTEEELLELIESAETLAIEKDLSPDPLEVDLAQELDRAIEETIRKPETGSDVAEAREPTHETTPDEGGS